MHPGPFTKLSTYVLLLMFFSGHAWSQEESRSEEIRTYLRSASALISQVDRSQQPGLAGNIALWQMRIGDLSGALSTARSVPRDLGPNFAMANVAAILTFQGNLPAALDLVRKSSEGNVSDAWVASRAFSYSSIAGALAGRRSFEAALKVARYIEEGPAYFSRSAQYLQVVLQIRSKQVEAGDGPGAAETLNLALKIVEDETQNPSDPEFAQCIPAGMYGSIAEELMREGNHADAMGVLARIYALVASAQTPKQRQDTLFSLAIALANIGEIDTARDIADRMERGERRASAMMVIADRRATAGNPIGALDWVMDISYEPWRNNSLRQIADSLAASGDYVQAISAIERIQGSGDRAYGLSELALEQALKNDPAAPFITEMAWDAALKAGAETKPIVFGQISVARALAGDFTGAVEVLGRLAGEDRVWPIENLTEMLARAGKKTDAIALAEGEDFPHAKACAFLGTATGLVSEQNKSVQGNE